MAQDTADRQGVPSSRQAHRRHTMTYSVALSGITDRLLREHLVRVDGQEDVCYALWYPGRGRDRTTALVTDPIFPMSGDRLVHGNAGTTGQYLMRAIDTARRHDAGVAFLHSHPFPGWQGMSEDDIHTERRQAAPVQAATGLPLVGLTVGSDGTWSGRLWPKTAPKTYDRQWAESVRVVGAAGLRIDFNDSHMLPPEFREELRRTISAWGDLAQADVARIRFGIVGAGSVGAIVAESLARMGVQRISLIDFDRVERHNLDRLLHATTSDASARRLKVRVLAEGLRTSATAADPRIEEFSFSVTEEDGFRAALDCDILFSCVDRPWPRHVLNYIAHAYLIPVIDGGIHIATKGHGRLRHASWRSHTIYPGTRCLACLGQYDTGHVETERRGDLEDPKYIHSLPAAHALRRNENVFTFSLHLASCLVMNALRLVLRPSGISNVGEQVYHFVDGTLDTSIGTQCDPGCYFSSITARGDREGLAITGIDPAATKARLVENRSEKRRRLWRRLRNWLEGVLPPGTGEP